MSQACLVRGHRRPVDLDQIAIVSIIMLLNSLFRTFSVFPRLAWLPKQAMPTLSNDAYVFLISWYGTNACALLFIFISIIGAILSYRIVSKNPSCLPTLNNQPSISPSPYLYTYSLIITHLITCLLYIPILILLNISWLYAPSGHLSLSSAKKNKFQVWYEKIDWTLVCLVLFIINALMKEGTGIYISWFVSDIWEFTLSCFCVYGKRDEVLVPFFWCFVGWTVQCTVWVHEKLKCVFSRSHFAHENAFSKNTSFGCTVHVSRSGPYAQQSPFFCSTSGQKSKCGPCASNSKDTNTQKKCILPLISNV